MIERMLFENLLTKATERLSQDLNTSSKYHNSRGFEQRVREVLGDLLTEMGLSVDMSPPAQEFPDIIIGNFGVEVKYSGSDSNLLIVFYVQIMPDDLVMQLHRF